MAWIESHQTLDAHPKTRKASRALGIRPVHLVGHLHFLWHWAVDMAEDGDLSKFDPEDLAIAADFDGDPDQFVDALVGCGPGDSPGFLERAGACGDPDDGRTGRLVLHDWWDYAGKLIASRQASRDDGARGNHIRHHVNRGIVSPACRFCSGGDSGGDRLPESGGESGLVAPPIAPTQPTEPDLTLQNQPDQPPAHAHDAAPTPSTSGPDRAGGDEDQLQTLNGYGEKTIGRLPDKALRLINGDSSRAVTKLHTALAAAQAAGVPPGQIRKLWDAPTALDADGIKSPAALLASRISKHLEEADRG